MTAGRPHGTSADDGEPLADVLAGGADEPDWRPWPRQRSLAIALAAAVAVPGAVLVQRQAVERRDAQAAPPVLVLAEGSEVLPRLGTGRPPGQLHVGLQLDVVNASGGTVVVTSAELVPGVWEVEVMDDADQRVRSERGRVLRPGWHATLVAHRLVDCAAVTCPGLGPRDLVVDVDRDGRHEQHHIDVGLGQSAYSGRLHGALGSPESACQDVADATPWHPPFLRLRIPSAR